MPRDPVYAMYGTDIDEAQYEIGYKELNLDKNIIERVCAPCISAAP